MAARKDPAQLATPQEADRTKIPREVKQQVFLEAGYRCGNPRCPTLVAIELHHIEYVCKGGSNEASNLLPLCPTCHARHHSKEITMEAVRVWKGLLVALNQAFDRKSRDLLLFLHHTKGQEIWYSGDGSLEFAGLIATGLVALSSSPIFVKSAPHPKSSQLTHAMFPPRDQIGLKIAIKLTEKGKHVVEAWLTGNDANLKAWESASATVTLLPTIS